MSNALILLIFFIIMLGSLFLGTPIFAGMGLASIIGILIWIAPKRLAQFGVIAYTQGTNFNQLILPMFIMMSEFLSQGNIASDIYTVLNKSIGRFKGGLAISTVLACTIFAALCGSSPATAASIGKISIKEMTKRGYQPAFAVGTVAAGGTLGIMIPPSITFCLYAALTENSIVKLFTAGILPGLMLAVMLILSIIIRVRLNPRLLDWKNDGKITDMTEEESRAMLYRVEQMKKAESGSIDLELETEKLNQTESNATFFTIIPSIVLILLVLGSMYLGWATPLEAAGYGVIGAFLILVFQRRLSLKVFSNVLLNSAKTGAMMVFLIICGFSMTFFVSYLGIPQGISTAIANSGVNKYIVLILMYILWFILGALMDPTSMVLLTIPFLYKTLMQFEFDPLWVAVVCVVGAQIAMITPPVGMNLFVLRANSDVPMKEIIKGALPYVGILTLGLILLTIFPQIATWLPSMVK